MGINIASGKWRAPVHSFTLSFVLMFPLTSLIHVLLVIMNGENVHLDTRGLWFIGDVFVCGWSSYYLQSLPRGERRVFVASSLWPPWVCTFKSLIGAHLTTISVGYRDVLSDFHECFPVHGDRNMLHDLGSHIQRFWAFLTTIFGGHGEGLSAWFPWVSSRH